MENELKSCPFCGGEAHIYQTERDGETQVQAQCKGCGAEIAFWLPWTADAGQKVSAWMDVERRWNSRATIAALEARVEALTRALTDLEKQASITANRGATLGPHWTHLSIACLKARAALSQKDTSDATDR